MKDLDSAIHLCTLEIQKNANNPSPVMALSCLFAAKGDYLGAFSIYTGLLNIGPGMLSLALNTPQNSVIRTSPPENQS
jgi:hypothetical protein